MERIKLTWKNKIGMCAVLLANTVLGSPFNWYVGKLIRENGLSEERFIPVWSLRDWFLWMFFNRIAYGDNGKKVGQWHMGRIYTMCRAGHFHMSGGWVFIVRDALSSLKKKDRTRILHYADEAVTSQVDDLIEQTNTSKCGGLQVGFEDADIVALIRSVTAQDYKAKWIVPVADTHVIRRLI